MSSKTSHFSSFNRSLKVDFQGSRVTSDGGLLLVRELDERLGLSALIADNIMDDRRDSMIKGEHRTRTILTTDTWVNDKGMWKLAAPSLPERIVAAATEVMFMNVLLCVRLSLTTLLILPVPPLHRIEQFP